MHEPERTRDIRLQLERQRNFASVVLGSIALTGAIGIGGHMVLSGHGGKMVDWYYVLGLGVTGFLLLFPDRLFGLVDRIRGRGKKEPTE